MCVRVCVCTCVCVCDLVHKCCRIAEIRNKSPIYNQTFRNVASPIFIILDFDLNFQCQTCRSGRIADMC